MAESGDDGTPASVQVTGGRDAYAAGRDLHVHLASPAQAGNEERLGTRADGSAGIQVGEGNIQHSTYIQTAATAARPKGRQRYLWGALAVIIVVLLGTFCYHEWWSPTTAIQSGSQVMVNGTDVQVFPPYDQPDGTQTYEYPVVNSDTPVSLQCYVSLPDGLWYQIYGNGGWIPRDAVHAIPGTAFPNPPHC
jgi:hypothetical protein